MSSAASTSRRLGHGARSEPVSRSHRATQVVLVLGSVLALAAASGPVWLVRVGVVLAVLTSVVTCSLAWRELAAARRRHAQRELVTDRRHGEVLREERTRTAEVLDTLAERLRSTGMVVAGQRGTITRLSDELTVRTAERDGLAEQVSERDGLLGVFRESLREQESVLLALRAEQAATAEQASRQASEQTDAEVRALPRRSRPAGSVLDPEMAELAMVLPNYESTRRAV